MRLLNLKLFDNEVNNVGQRKQMLGTCLLSTLNVIIVIICIIATWVLLVWRIMIVTVLNSTSWLRTEGVRTTRVSPINVKFLKIKKWILIISYFFKYLIRDLLTI